MVSFPVLSEAVVRILHEVVQREVAQVPFPFLYFILLDFFCMGKRSLRSTKEELYILGKRDEYADTDGEMERERESERDSNRGTAD